MLRRWRRFLPTATNLPRPQVLRRMHGIATVGWFAMIPISVLTGLRNSVPYLVALSVYALAVGHFASWQGSRAEIESNGSTKEDG